VSSSYTDTSPTQHQFTQPAPPAGTSAGVYGTVHSMNADVQVRATEHLNVFALAGAVAGGAGAIGAGITIMTISGNTDAGIFAGASVSAGGTVGVHAEYDENVTDIGVTGAIGAVAIAGQIVVLTDTSTQTAHIDALASIPQAGTGIDVTALANRTIKGYAIGITLAAGAVGAAIAVISISGDTQALVDNVAIGPGSVGGLNVTATDNFHPTVVVVGAVAGAGLSISGIVAVVSLSLIHI